MICKTCGYCNESGFLCCMQCGAPIPADEGKDRQYSQPGYDNDPVSVKKRRGLLIGLIAGGAALLAGAAAAMYFFLLAGTPIGGLWYNEDMGYVLDFRNDGIVVSSNLFGVHEAGYDYDKKSAKGTLTVGDEKGDLTIEKDVMTVDIGGAAMDYKRAGMDFNSEEFVVGYLYALWSNKEIPEVIELKDDGIFIIHNTKEDVYGEFTYDFEGGKGVFTVYEEDYVFNASPFQIDVADTRTYMKEGEGFDFRGFLKEYEFYIQGDWYDCEGISGTFSFMEDGKVNLLTLGKKLSGKYEFDKSSGTGTMVIDNEKFDLEIRNGYLIIYGRYYSRTHVEQMDREDYFAAVLGKWYSTDDEAGTIEFNLDQTAQFVIKGIPINATFSFDTVDKTGTIVIRDAGAQVDFHISDGLLVVGDAVYGRDSLEQAE